MNFRRQSMESPLRLTPQFDAHKSQTPVSGSVVYKKMPGPFKTGERKGEKKCADKRPGEDIMNPQ